ncbi:hypothetical protein D3C72_867340 [compost metagenome]
MSLPDVLKISLSYALIGVRDFNFELIASKSKPVFVSNSNLGIGKIEVSLPNSQ